MLEFIEMRWPRAASTSTFLVPSCLGVKSEPVPVSSHTKAPWHKAQGVEVHKNDSINGALEQRNAGGKAVHEVLAPDRPQFTGGKQPSQGNVSNCILNGSRIVMRFGE